MGRKEGGNTLRWRRRKGKSMSSSLPEFSALIAASILQVHLVGNYLWTKHDNIPLVMLPEFSQSATCKGNNEYPEDRLVSFEYAQYYDTWLYK